jgi:hypothetical protein
LAAAAAAAQFSLGARENQGAFLLQPLVFELEKISSSSS